MDKVQLSDLADMDAKERAQTYDEIMRRAARPEQITSLQPFSRAGQFEPIQQAFSLLRSEDARRLVSVKGGATNPVVPHR